MQPRQRERRAADITIAANFDWRGRVALPACKMRVIVPNGEKSPHGEGGSEAALAPRFVLDLECENCAALEFGPGEHLEFGVCGKCDILAVVHTYKVVSRDFDAVSYLPVFRLAFSETSEVDGSTCYHPTRRVLESTDVSTMVRRFVQAHGFLIQSLTGEARSMSDLPPEWIEAFCPLAAALPCRLDVDGYTALVSLGA